MRRARAQESGFSLIELLVTMAIVAEILVVASVVLTVHDRVARVSTQVADMQQSLRIGQYEIARLLRMAGRGGLPLDFNNVNPTYATGRPPRSGAPAIQSLALEVRDNVGEGGTSREIAIGYANSPLALQGTDILIVRGCFSNLYVALANLTAPLDSDGDSSLDTASLTLLPTFTAELGQTSQPFTPILDNVLGPWVLTSQADRDIISVPTVTAGAFAGGNTSLDLTMTFPKPGTNATPDPFWVYPTAMSFNVGTACRLEEYRFYIHEENLSLPNGATRIRPRLAMARMKPGTETPYLDDSTNLFIPIADEVFDLQVALGFDTPNHGQFSDDDDNVGDDDTIFEGNDATSRQTDDWLFNTPTDQTGNSIVPGPNGWGTRLYQVRFTLLAETENEDTQYNTNGIRGGRIGPDLGLGGDDMVEDHDYDTAPAKNFKSQPYTMHRRRLLTTVINVRNL